MIILLNVISSITIFMPDENIKFKEKKYIIVTGCLFADTIHREP
jgi:hypothetical protein